MRTLTYLLLLCCYIPSMYAANQRMIPSLKKLAKRALINHDIPWERIEPISLRNKLALSIVKRNKKRKAAIQTIKTNQINDPLDTIARNRYLIRNYVLYQGEQFPPLYKSIIESWSLLYPVIVTAVAIPLLSCCIVISDTIAKTYAQPLDVIIMTAGTLCSTCSIFTCVYFTQPSIILKKYNRSALRSNVQRAEAILNNHAPQPHTEDICEQENN